jgi:hypothetical protein
MTQEDKNLLLRDLSARLSYHVRCKVWLKDGTTEEGVLDLEHNYGDVLRDAFYYNKIVDIKPFLRPMSSMTEEERKEYNEYLFHGASIGLMSNTETAYELIDWLNAHYFDYRGLIEKDLAIAVTEENNPYEKGI